MPLDQDDIIKGTDNDALSSRLSCFLKGYLPGDTAIAEVVPLMVRYKLLSIESEFKRFAVARNLKKSYFNLVDTSANNGSQPLRRPSAGQLVLKSPVINRGTWLRTAAINEVIDQFLAKSLAAGEQVQILSLGAGNDTRPFYLVPKYANLTYFETDFEGSCKIKKCSILSSESLRSAVGLNDSSNSQSPPTTYKEFEQIDCNLDTDRYHLLAGDLRNGVPESASFDWSKRTLVLSECCICYMGTEESDRLLQSLKDGLDHGEFCIYEPMGGEESSESRYGQVMVHNLKTRGIEMPNLMVYNTTEKQRSRFLKMGISSSDLQVEDMKQVYNRMPRGEIGRISRLEMLDELEELNLINSHYCLVQATW